MATMAGKTIEVVGKAPISNIVPLHGYAIQLFGELFNIPQANLQYTHVRHLDTNSTLTDYTYPDGSMLKVVRSKRFGYRIWEIY